MMRATVLMVGLAMGVAACGVDGEPKTPPAREDRATPQAGVSISGTASVGVVGGSS